MTHSIKDFGQRDFLTASYLFNVLSVGFLTAAAAVIEVSWWIPLLLGVLVIIAMQVLWIISFIVFSVIFLYGVSALRGLLDFVFRRKKRPTQTGEKPSDSEEKIFQAMRWSSLSMMAIPLVCLLGVAVIDIFTSKNLVKAYLICVSHGCVGLVGWLLAMNALIIPMPTFDVDGYLAFLNEPPEL